MAEQKEKVGTIRALEDWRNIALKILRLYHDDGEHFTVYPSPLTALTENEKSFVMRYLTGEIT